LSSNDGSAEKVVVVGQGYVGLPLAMRAVEVGFDVVGLDRDTDKVKQLAAGRSYIEDVDDDRLGRALATDRCRLTATLVKMPVITITRVLPVAWAAIVSGSTQASARSDTSRAPTGDEEPSHRRAPKAPVLPIEQFAEATVAARPFSTGGSRTTTGFPLRLLNPRPSKA
jgi:hypothetical protein